jgi:hypothetical protein
VRPWDLVSWGVNEIQGGGALKQLNLTLGRYIGGFVIKIGCRGNGGGDLMTWKQHNLMSIQGGFYPSYLDIKEHRAYQE